MVIRQELQRQNRALIRKVTKWKGKAERSGAMQRQGNVWHSRGVERRRSEKQRQSIAWQGQRTAWSRKVKK